MVQLFNDKVFDLFNVAYARYIINDISKSKLYTK